MRDILDLDRYPLDRPGSPEWLALVETSKAALAANGMFNLEGLLLPGIAERAAAEVKPVMDAKSHTHKRLHNIYFKPEIPELAADHPALRKVETVTPCARTRLRQALFWTSTNMSPLCISWPQRWTSRLCTSWLIRWPAPTSWPIAKARP